MYHFKDRIAWGEHWFKQTQEFANYSTNMPLTAHELKWGRELATEMSKALGIILHKFYPPSALKAMP